MTTDEPTQASLSHWFLALHDQLQELDTVIEADCYGDTHDRLSGCLSMAVGISVKLRERLGVTADDLELARLQSRRQRLAARIATLDEQIAKALKNDDAVFVLSDKGRALANGQPTD